MNKWVLILSLVLNVALVALLLFLNGRYNFVGKAKRVVLAEGRVPGLAAPYQMNRNYAARRAMFALDRSTGARILFLGDSQVALADWNALLGAPLVANRGIEGDTSAGVLARLGDYDNFAGGTIVLWIGTNDVLHGIPPTEIAGNIAKIVAVVQGIADGGWRMAESGERRAEWRMAEGEENAEPEAERPEMALRQMRKGEIANGGWRMAEATGSRGPRDQRAAESSRRVAPQPTDKGPRAEKLKGEMASGEGRMAEEEREDNAEPEAERPEMALRQMRKNEMADGEWRMADGAGRKVIVLGVAPVASWVERAAERNLAVAEVNEQLAAAAHDGKFAFIDLDPILCDPQGYLRSDMTWDGVHVNAAAYQEIMQKLKSVITNSE